MSMTAAEYAALDATALAALVKRKEVSAMELVDIAIEQIEALNPTLNAVVTRMYDHARRQAQQTNADLPFAGVPFLMKDFAAEIKGFPFTECSAFLSGYVPDQDSELYRRFCRSGLITIGKTNLPEFAIGATTEPRLFGPTRNPWDTGRTTGGSSGGAGAAVAAGIVPMAHGNDVGGSIRIPASCCGLVGLKPSRGRSTLAPHYGDLLAGFFVEHALTRSVRDCASLLDAIAGPATGEPYAASAPAQPFAMAPGAGTGQLRIGFSDLTPLGDRIDDECTQAVHATAALLESLGHRVEPAQPQYDAEQLWQGFTNMMACGAAWAMADWARRLRKTPTADDFEPFVWAFAEHGRTLTGADYLLALQDVQLQVRALSAFYEDHDVFMTSTLGKPPVELGTLIYQGDPFELRRRTAAFSPYCYVTNASGQPSISLPLHASADGLPIGIHFTAAYGEEALLLRLASQLETAQPWSGKQPPVHVG